MFARFRERDRFLERSARLRRLLGLPPLITAPGADADHGGNAGGDEITAVALPQLFELFAADFLINFLKNVGHAIALNAWPHNGAAAGRVLRSGSNSRCRRAVR